jgi:Bacterial pre-peptidase C-terminal domain
MRLRFQALLLLTAAVGFYASAGCDPYNPSLPSEPFICASTEPKCPNGYMCDNGSGRVTPTCVKIGGSTIDSGVGSDSTVATSCDGPPDRDFEPNETTSAAIQLPTVPHYVVPAVGICSADDADMYWLMLVTGSHLLFRADFTHTAGDLTLALLNENASQVRFSDASSSTNNFESIDVTNIPGGKYYIRVKGKDPAVRNTYTLTIDVTN